MKPKASPIQTRAHVAAIQIPDNESAPIRAALSTETIVQRGFGAERLVHSRDAIQMEASSLPLTINHSESNPFSDQLPIGRVQNISLDSDNVLRGDLVFDSDEVGEAARGKVMRGMAPDGSLTYRIHDYKRGDEADSVDVTKWQPLAYSLVTVPADPNSGIGRSLDLNEGAPDVDDNTTPAPASGADDDILSSVQDRSQAGYQRGAAAERARLSEIAQTTANLTRAMPGITAEADALQQQCIERGITADQHRSLAFKLMGSGAEPLSGEPMPSPLQHRPPNGLNRQPLVQAGQQDGVKAQHRGMEFALLERSGGKVKPEDMEGNQYRGWSMLDMARASLEAHGMRTSGMSSEQIAKAAIQQRAISPGTANYVTSDFPAVTENVITKRVFDGFSEQARVWDAICSTNEVPDFKQFSVPRLSQISSLPVVAENAAYTDLTQVDAKESATLVKRGGLMSFSWEAMVNDDQSMFGRTAERMGGSAQRTIDEQFFAFLAANGNMGDGNPLFDNLNHGNSGTDALDLAGLVATRTRMAKQTDENSVLLGIMLRIILVPEELRDTADNLAGSEYLPWPESAPGAQRVNTVRSTFTVQASARLTDANDWYAFTAPGGTIECAFLRGNRAPVLERDMGWDTDAMHFKVRQPHIFYAVDWRGVQRNVVT